MRTRPVVAVLSAVALVGGAGSAVAASKPVVKPVCNLISDAAGDTFAVRAQDTEGVFGPQEDGFDITSVDLASDAKFLTGVVRVKKLATAIQSAPNGIDFRISFTLPGQDPSAENLFLNARFVSGAPAFLLGKRTVVGAAGESTGQSTTAKLADATGTFDTAKNEVRISVPTSAVTSGSETLKNGVVLSLTDLDQTSARNVAINPATSIGTATFADVANGEVTYKAGAPSCVKPGA